MEGNLGEFGRDRSPPFEGREFGRNWSPPFEGGVRGG
jgi:hypothetical protein